MITFLFKTALKWPKKVKKRGRGARPHPVHLKTQKNESANPHFALKFGISEFLSVLHVA